MSDQQHSVQGLNWREMMLAECEIATVRAEAQTSATVQLSNQPLYPIQLSFQVVPWNLSFGLLRQIKRAAARRQLRGGILPAALNAAMVGAKEENFFIVYEEKPEAKQLEVQQKQIAT